MSVDVRAPLSSDAAESINEISAPLTVSTAEGEIYSGDSLADRLAAVRRGVDPVPGSCNWSGWGS